MVTYTTESCPGLLQIRNPIPSFQKISSWVRQTLDHKILELVGFVSVPESPAGALFGAPLIAQALASSSRAILPAV